MHARGMMSMRLNCARFSQRSSESNTVGKTMEYTILNGESTWKRLIRILLLLPILEYSSN
eukprot:99974-Prymnesium_polylepis.1